MAQVWVITNGSLNESGDLYDIYDDEDFAFEEFMEEHRNRPHATPVERLSDDSAYFYSGVEWFQLRPRNVRTRGDR